MFAWCARLCGVHKTSPYGPGSGELPLPRGQFFIRHAHFTRNEVSMQYLVVFCRILVGCWSSEERSPRMLTDVKIDGQRVRAARERAFLSKRELADQAGLDRSTVGRIEEGVTEVYPRTIRRIAEALSVDPTSLTPQE